MLFLTIPTANAHPKLLAAIIENSSLPPEQIILVATRPNLALSNNCIVIEDLGSPNIQRWWNVGIEAAITRGATAVAVLNDDLKINTETLPTLYTELQRTNAAIACPTRPDWGDGHYKNNNIFPYTPVILGCLWMLNTQYPLRPDPQYVWWYGDSDLDIRARCDYSGIVTADVYYEHFFSGEGTRKSTSLAAQTERDGETFESNYVNFLATSRSTTPRKLFIQVQQYPARISDESNYREDFFRYISESADPERDRVVLIEPNAELHKSIRDLWATWQNVLIMEKVLTFDKTPHGVTMYRADPALSFESRQSVFSIEVQRFAPTFKLEEVLVGTVNLNELVNKVAPGAKIHTLAFDSRTYSLAEMLQTPNQPREIIAVAADCDDGALVAEARSLGLQFTGRPWGEAHSTAAFSYQRRKWSRTIRTLAGHAVSKLVDAHNNLTTSSTLKDTFHTKVTRKFSEAHLLDKDHGRSAKNISPQRVDTLLKRVAGTTNTPELSDLEWQVDVDPNKRIQDLSEKCFDAHGVWPLSMSIPTHIALNPHPTQLVSAIIPGYPYSFHSESEYLAKYADSYLSLTHRKAGWDCFRHVEIMASGSVPLMPDASEIPEFSMVHYPKQAFAQIAHKALVDGGHPSWELRSRLRDFFLMHLTTKSMGSYILKAAKIPPDAKVLFLDENLASNPEYISALTAIGLKENLGTNCVLIPNPDFLYSDSLTNTLDFYGRGFGYLKHLDPESRFGWEKERTSGSGLEDIPWNQYDFVVVGSVSRNERLTQQALANHPGARIVLIHGEDTPPTAATSQFLGSTNAHIFIRSIN